MLLLNKMQTPLEFDVYELNTISPPHSALIYGSMFFVKCVSCKQYIPYFLFLKKLKTSFLFEQSPRPLQFVDEISLDFFYLSL